MAHRPTLPAAQASAAAAAAYLAQARQHTEQGAEWPRGVELPPLTRLAVLGAGTMGCGIALCALAAGLETRLIDIQPDALQRGLRRIHDSLDKAVRQGRLAPAVRDARLARLSHDTMLRELGTFDAVIEAVFENMALKQSVMAQLHAQCPAHTLLISNTSTLDISALAGASGRPDRMLGMHFLTPAHVTPLLEIVPGAATSASSLARARALALRLGKLPVWAGNSWGFIGNRMFEGYLQEVDTLQLQGVPAERIDRALEHFGFALGPCRTLDMAGTDLVSQVLLERARLFPQAPAYRRITQALAALGRCGRKSGRGHYLYEGPEGRLLHMDPDLPRLCAQEAAQLGIAQQPEVSDAEIVRRCVQPLMQEGQRLLQEGMARRASDIDLVWVLGYGFPADRGGPMYLAGQTDATA